MDSIADIKDQVGIYQVLRAYGVEFLGTGYPEQLHCPFHGADVNKSARVYPESETVYCFVCDESWDVISFVQDQEELSFSETCKLMREKWNVSLTMPDYEANLYAARRKPTANIDEFADTVEKLFIEYANDLTSGEISSILISYNECFAEKDLLLLQEYVSMEDLKRWYKSSKLKLRTERPHG